MELTRLLGHPILCVARGKERLDRWAAATLVDGGDLASTSLEDGEFVAAELDGYPADQTGMLRARSSAIGP
jgi:hypothetical protein